MADTCDQHGFTEDDQDWDNPCTCGLPPGHAGLHECQEGCGGTWAGGISAERYRVSTPYQPMVSEDER